MTVLMAYLDPSKSVVPMEEAYPAGVGTKQIQAEDAALMRGSQQDAQAAALTYLGIDYVSRVYIEAMFEDSAAMGILKPGDFIDSVNGEKVADNDLLRKRVKAWDGGDPIKVGITRKGESSVVEVTPAKVNGEYYLGVFVTYRYTFPFKIEVDLGDVGGPSAGSMFALGIIDKLTPGAMTNGQTIAGTGTISPTGKVGPIGGIVQKMYAAKNIGADVFLAPAENCSETVGNTPEGLKVYRIERLNQAVELLKAIQTGSNLSGFATCSK
jgi:PDZ domain-containing protein